MSSDLEESDDRKKVAHDLADQCPEDASSPKEELESAIKSLARQAVELDGQIDSQADSKVEKIARVLLSETYSGPFAHPDILRRLDQVVDNGAERAFKLTELEQSHRHSMEEKIVSAQIEDRKKRAVDRRIVIWCSFGYLLASLIATLVLAITGHAVGAGLSGGSGVLVAVIGGVFGLRARATPDLSESD